MTLVRKWCFPLAFVSSVAMQAQRADLVLAETGHRITIIQRSSPTPHHQDSGLLDVHVGEQTFHIRINSRSVIVPRDREGQSAMGGLPRIAGLELDPARFFFRGTYKDDQGVHTLLFFVGQASGSDADPLFILGFTPEGTPYKVMQSEAFEPSAFENDAGQVRIIGKQTLSQVMACMDYKPASTPYATTYDPYAVYVVRAGVTATYSLAQSRQYNLDHYVWAGPKSSETYMVIYNLPGHRKPFGAPAKRADAMLPHCKEDGK